MAIVNTPKRPAYATPPGSTLKDLMEERGMSLVDLVKQMHGVTIFDIRGFIAGKVELTPSMSKQFEAIFGLKESFWINREAAYRYHLELEREKKESRNGRRRKERRRSEHDFGNQEAV